MNSNPIRIVRDRRDELADKAKKLRDDLDRVLIQLAEANAILERMAAQASKLERDLVAGSQPTATDVILSVLAALKARGQEEVDSSTVYELARKRLPGVKSTTLRQALFRLQKGNQLARKESVVSLVRGS